MVGSEKTHTPPLAGSDAEGSGSHTGDRCTTRGPTEHQWSFTGRREKQHSLGPADLSEQLRSTTALPRWRAVQGRMQATESGEQREAVKGAVEGQ